MSEWLSGDQKFSCAEILVGATKTCISGYDLLCDKTWKVPDGSVWSFAGRGGGETASFCPEELR